jgi:hypothetical protein
MDDLKHEFESAYTKHILFKSKVKSYLYGSDTPLEPIVDYRQCNFGIWIEDKGLPLYGHIPEMQQLDQVHRAIHDWAINLVNLKKKGQEEEAIAGIPVLEEIAAQITKLLQTIREKAA